MLSIQRILSDSRKAGTSITVELLGGALVFSMLALVAVGVAVVL